MFFKRSFHVPMAEASDGGAAGGAGSGGDSGDAGAGGAGAAGSAGAAAGAGAGGANAGAAAGGAGAGNALASGASGGAAGAGGAQGAGASGAAAEGPLAGIPEKFHVKNADGTPDIAASWAKVEQHRSHLEKRLGAGDIPPAAATDYKVNLPEALKDAIKVDELSASPEFQKFTAGLHAMGLTQKQYDGVVAEMLDRSIALQKGMAGLDTNACLAELDKTWATPDERQKNVTAAYRAASTFGDVDGLMKKYGNDPDFIRFAARVGAELGEDTSAGAAAGGQASGEAEIQALASSKAYFDPADPQHAITKAKVTAFYEKKFGTAPKSNGSVSIGAVG